MTQRAVPMVSYEDVATAIDWLANAFGFRERGERFTDAEGRVTQAEVELEGATVMVGWPGAAYRSPTHHSETCAEAAEWLAVPWVVDGVYVTVRDVDALLRRAVAAGATVLREPDDLPFGRICTLADPEGHRWMFAQLNES